jgi:tRNA (guanine-N7-)-methyltransferase
MKERRRIEREFGVPIAGEIVDQALWSRTGLKKLPAQGPLNWAAVFGRTAPVIVDLGCGNGRFLIGSAVWRPAFDHVGVDVLPLVIRYATRRGNQRGLRNIRFVVMDALQFLTRHAVPGTIAEIHCYHPQPYYVPAQVHRRLLTPSFLMEVHRALVPGGLLFLQTDNPGYWSYMKQVVPFFFEFEERETVWPDAPKGRTRREIIALRRGLPVFRGMGKAKPGLSPGDSLRLASALPPPRFDADRRLQELDNLEHSPRSLSE